MDGEEKKLFFVDWDGRKNDNWRRFGEHVNVDMLSSSRFRHQRLDLIFQFLFHKMEF